MPTLDHLSRGGLPLFASGRGSTACCPRRIAVSGWRLDDAKKRPANCIEVGLALRANLVAMGSDFVRHPERV